MCCSKVYMSGWLHVRIPSGVAWSSLYFMECEELDIRHVFCRLTL